MAKGPVNSSIEIYLRVRPVPKPSPQFVIDHDEGTVEFNIPRDQSAGLVNNQREHYQFRFNGILAPDAKQDDVFETVARPVVDATLDGIHGTVFAYGQTGSGKTFTITGGPERYVDRGIIPRAISHIFDQLQKRASHQYSVHISYLEIYKEAGYDLLDPGRDVKQLEDLPRVTVMEDEDRDIHMKGLSLHRANTEEEALNLLFLGDTNRTISETPMNQASSRSHCVFTLHMEARQVGEDTVRRSKLNLVDLAGSERVSKTRIDGTILQEAKFINVSLHFLEQVIIALQERAMGQSRPHVPYRNSMMTMVLRDSLGGNCQTVMIANATSDGAHMDESISTCRFAQRVACISNQVEVNEELDPNLVIKRLKAEIRDLKEQIRLLQGGGEPRGPLTEDELDSLRQRIQAYCSEAGTSLAVPGDMVYIQAAFDEFRNLVRNPPASASQEDAAQEHVGPEALEQLRKLKLQVQQRDNEINILVSMLKKREAGRAAPLAPSLLQAADPSATPTPAAAGPGSATAPAAAPVLSGAAPLGDGALLDASILADRNRAFEVFRKSYRKSEVVEENKALLRQKYEQAKSLGNRVNQSKQRISVLKHSIEQRRAQRAAAKVAQEMADASTPGDPASSAAATAQGGEEEEQEEEEEARAKAEIEAEKSSYKEAFHQLRGLKKEIEHLQMLLEQSRSRLQKDFQQWMESMLRQQQTASSSTVSGSPPVVQHDSPAPVALPIATSGGLHVAPADPTSTGAPAPAAADPPRFARRHAWGEESISASRHTLPAVSDSASHLTGKDDATESVSAAGVVVPAAVYAAAQPFLTGDDAADADILRFYEARAKLLQSQETSADIPAYRTS